MCPSLDISSFLWLRREPIVKIEPGHYGSRHHVVDSVLLLVSLKDQATEVDSKICDALSTQLRLIWMGCVEMTLNAVNFGERFVAAAAWQAEMEMLF